MRHSGVAVPSAVVFSHTMPTLHFVEATPESIVHAVLYSRVPSTGVAILRIDFSYWKGRLTLIDTYNPAFLDAPHVLALLHI